MSVSTTVQMKLTTVETPASNVPAMNTQSSLTHNGFDVSKTLNATSTPPATQCAYQEKVLTAGAATLDLRTLTGSNSLAVDLNGLKPVAILVKAPATNTNPITLGVGASNGYDGLGSAFEVTLKPGMSVQLDLHNQGTAVSGTNKTLDLTGTGSTDKLQFGVVAGT